MAFVNYHSEYCLQSGEEQTEWVCLIDVNKIINFNFVFSQL